MTFWIILVAMTVAAFAFVAWPFVFPPKGLRAGGDLAVYRDQLDELERDRTAGHISDADADAARLEVSRRLLKAADGPDAAAAEAAPASGRTARAAAVIVAAILLPALSAALYYKLGTPSAALPKVVAQSRPGELTVEEMIAKVEQHLQSTPDDGRSWEVLAPVYMRVGRYDAAVEAWRNVLRVNGENAERLENLGESIVAMSDGVVTEDAKEAFDRALELDKNAVAARYYRGLAALQDGRNEDARRQWTDMLTTAPADATWAESVRQSLARLDGKAPQADAGRQSGEPNAQQMADAAKLPDEHQDEMIRGMIEKLAARLKLNGDDPEGWARLARSYRVIGDADRYEAAKADARKALAASPLKLAIFEESIRDAGGAPAEQPASRPASQQPSGAAAPSRSLSRGDAAPAPAPTAASQDETIRGMVSRLADKLKANGDDPEGWVRLVRSYSVLGEPDKLAQAVADARKALAGAPEKLAQFEAGAKQLGIQQ